MRQQTKTLKAFESNLKLSLVSNTLVSEDSVRFSFFAAMLGAGVAPHDVTLECSHPMLERKKIDTYVKAFGGVDTYLEFKFDRKPSSGDQNKTDRGRAVLKDWIRLCMIDGSRCRRLFVYVTDDGMWDYFQNRSNKFRALIPGSESWKRVERALVDEQFGEGEGKFPADSFEVSARRVWGFGFGCDSKLFHCSILEVKKWPVASKGR